MPNQVIFGGKTIVQPGSYGQVLSGIKNPPAALSYGNIAIIDTGSGAGFGFGSGIAGELAEKKSAIYAFDSASDFQDAMKGGKWWKLAEPLFRPTGAGTPGVSRVYYIRAAATACAEAAYTWTNGSFTLQARSEGLVGNAILTGGTVATGSFTVATVVTGDVFTVKVTAAGLPDVILATYTVLPGATTSSVASAIASDINANTAYSATVNGSTITIAAPTPVGNEEEADWNAKTLVVAITGTSTTSGLASFSGGSNAAMLSQGYAITMEVGTVDNTKFVLKFWQGTFKGYDSQNYPYDGISINLAAPKLLAKSPEFNDLITLKAWLENNATFNSYFRLKTSTIAGAGAVISADLLASAGYNKFAGGTETYNNTHFLSVLDAIPDLDFTFFLSDQSGAQAMSATNAAILNHITTDARYEKFLVIGGGDSADTFDSQSIAAAKYWDNDRVIVVHGSPKIATLGVPGGFKENYGAIYKAAAVLGRIAGLSPQIPGSFKSLKIQGEVHELNNKEVDKALLAGLLVTRYDIELEKFVIVQSVNTLQANEYLVNEDGTSSSIEVKRIAAQLNKEIVINAKKQLLGAENGPNRNTLSAIDVATWLSSYLGSRTASTTQDNLILGFEEINVEVRGADYFISYGFVPNFPVNRLFFTGFILDPTIG